MVVETMYSAWKADVLPLNYTRMCPRRGYVKGDICRRSFPAVRQQNIASMEVFALIGFFARPRSCAVSGRIGPPSGP